LTYQGCRSAYHGAPVDLVWYWSMRSVCRQLPTLRYPSRLDLASVSELEYTIPNWALMQDSGDTAMSTTSAVAIPARKAPPSAPPRLLDVLRQVATARGHSLDTIREFVNWTTRFILFHCKRHPRELTNCEIGRFLGHVAQTEKDPVRSIQAARAA